VWLYLAQFPLLAAAYLGCDSLIRCTRFLYAVVVVQALAAAVFVFMPLRYPRELHVASIGADPITRALADWVRAIDPPVNCFPSLHVTSCVLVMMLVGVERAPRALAYGMVALASIASTLTFKQHYAIDLVAGALLAATGWWAAGRIVAAGPAGIGTRDAGPPGDNPVSAIK
jgi:membrane-associated phospholipid phosphatase